MTETILTAIGAVLGIVGLTEIIHSIRVRILSPKYPPQTVVTVYLYGEDADLQLIYAINKYKNNLLLRTVAVITELDEERKELCRKIAEKYDVEILD